MDTDKRIRKKQEEKNLTPGEKVKKELLSWIWSLLVAAAVVFLLYTFVFMLIRVEGTSMDTTLADGERLFVTVADMKLNGPFRGEVVICRYPNRGRQNFVKRVVGLPGDTVERVDGVTYVTYKDENGETVRESLDRAPGSYEDYAPYTLDEDEYFVVGDNRAVSHDSRDWKDSDSSRDVGPIRKNMIIGRVRYVIWPLGDIRSVE